MNAHEKIKKLLIGFVLGELSEQQQSEVKAHIADCPECRSYLEKIQAVLKYADNMGQLSVDNESCELAEQTLLECIQRESLKEPISTPAVYRELFYRRKVMNSKIIKLAVAAVILIAAGVAITTVITSKQTKKETFVQEISKSKATDSRIITTEDTKLEEQLKQAEKMLAARDVDGLIDMLNDGQMKAKIAAANFLAKIGDSRAIEALSRLSEQWTDETTENPFAAAIINIENSSATAQEQAAQDTNAPSDVLVDSSADELLQLIPSRSLFCLRVNNFDLTIGKIDSYLTGISPMPMGLSMAARMQLANVLCNPMLNGVNTTGNFAVFGLSLESSGTETASNVFASALIPVTDYDKFIKDNPNYSTPDANGVSEIKSIMDQRVRNIVSRLHNYALITTPNHYDRLVSFVKSFSGGNEGLLKSLESSQIEAATKAPLWAYGNVRIASKVFEPIISKKIEEIKKQIERGNVNRRGQVVPPTATLNMYVGMLDILMYEVDSVCLALWPQQDVLRANINMKAVPDTATAKMFVADTIDRRENKLLNYFTDGAVFNLAMKANTPFLKELSISNFDMVSFLDEKGEIITQESMGKLEKLIAENIASLGNYGIVSLGSKSSEWPPFSYQCIFEVQNGEQFKRTSREILNFWNTGGFAECYRRLLNIDSKFELKEAAETYQNVPIDYVRFIMKSTDPNSQYGDMIDRMYQGGFGLRFALLDGLNLCAVGADCNSTIHRLIDDVKSGGHTERAAEIKAALAILTESENSDFVGTYNYLRMFQMAFAMASIEMADTALLMVDTPVKSNIAFAGKIDNGRVAVELALPKDHLIEIKTAAMEIAQKMQLLALRRQALNEITAGSGNIAADIPIEIPDSNDEQAAIEGLAAFAEISGGRYPSNLLDVSIVTKEASILFRQKLSNDPNRDANLTPSQEEIEKFLSIQSSYLFYSKLTRENKDPAYYGDKVSMEFPDAVLMRWKIDEQYYRVIFADLSSQNVTAEQLAQLEAMPLNTSSKALKPQPSDGSVVGEVPGLKFSWLPGMNVTAHRVYFGTDANNLSFLAEVTSPGADLPELEKQTTYYWRVDEVQPDGSIVAGKVWNFKTATLLSWWRFDENQGSRVIDSSGNNNNGIIVGEPMWQPNEGVTGGSLSFDGNDDYVSIPAFKLRSNAVTISAWIKRNGDQHNFSGIVFSRTENNCSGINFSWGNRLGYHWNWNRDTYTWDSGLIVPDNKWVFVALVVEPTKATIYLFEDGAMKTATNYISHKKERIDGTICIGRDLNPDYPERFIRASVDDVRIYNEALSQAAIEALYNTAQPVQTEEAAPVKLHQTSAEVVFTL